MKNFLFSIALILLSFVGHEVILPVTKMASTIQEPAYAKWGRLAVEKAKERYPEAEIVDYLYVGRRNLDRTTTETFKLWIREAEREFGVFITIEFDQQNEAVKKIEFMETPN